MTAVEQSLAVLTWKGFDCIQHNHYSVPYFINIYALFYLLWYLHFIYSSAQIHLSVSQVFLSSSAQLFRHTPSSFSLDKIFRHQIERDAQKVLVWSLIGTWKSCLETCCHRSLNTGCKDPHGVLEFSRLSSWFIFHTFGIFYYYPLFSFPEDWRKLIIYTEMKCIASGQKDNFQEIQSREILDFCKMDKFSP